MLKLVFVVFLSAQLWPGQAKSIDLPINSFVVGGNRAKDGQFPFAVALRDPDNKDLLCGGALLSDKYVLTAGHCVERKQPSWVSVGVGSVDLRSQKFYKVEKFIIHPPSNVSALFNDIALLKLSSPIPLGGNVQTILPFEDNDLLVGKNVTGMGWGYTTQNGPISMNLLYLDPQQIITNDNCQKRIGKDRLVGSGNICTSGQLDHGICYFDSGSPLAYKAANGKTYVVGLAAWGIQCAKGYPDVFTRVSHYSKWIKENMK